MQIGKTLYYVEDNSKEEDYISFNFQPNYFSPDFTRGNTDLTVRLVLPTGMTENDPVYFPPQNWDGASEPETWFNDNGNVVYEWHSTQANSRSEYIFGAMFPKRILTSADQISDPKSYSSSPSSSGGNTFLTQSFRSRFVLSPFQLFSCHSLQSSKKRRT
jgi:hypothetical protein